MDGRGCRSLRAPRGNWPQIPQEGPRKARLCHGPAPEGGAPDLPELVLVMAKMGCSEFEMCKAGMTEKGGTQFLLWNCVVDKEPAPKPGALPVRARRP